MKKNHISLIISKHLAIIFYHWFDPIKAHNQGTFETEQK